MSDELILEEMLEIASKVTSWEYSRGDGLERFCGRFGRAVVSVEHHVWGNEPHESWRIKVIQDGDELGSKEWPIMK